MVRFPPGSFNFSKRILPSCWGELMLKEPPASSSLNPLVDGYALTADGNIKVEQIDPDNLKVIIQSILDGDGTRR